MVAGLIECILFTLDLLGKSGASLLVEGPFFVGLFETKVCHRFWVCFRGLTSNLFFPESQDPFLVAGRGLTPEVFLQLALTVQVVHLLLVPFELAQEGVELDF